MYVLSIYFEENKSLHKITYSSFIIKYNEQTKYIDFHSKILEYVGKCVQIKCFNR